MSKAPPTWTSTPPPSPLGTTTPATTTPGEAAPGWSAPGWSAPGWSTPAGEPSRGAWSVDGGDLPPRGQADRGRPGGSSGQAEEDLPPSQRYQRGGLIGRGGMGLVSVAHDARLGREVALKELDPALVASPRAAQRLLREAWITAHLDHPSVVAVHDIGHLDDGRPFYTMHLVRGRSLAQALDEDTTPPARRALLRHLLAACEAAAAAHEAGIVHRDLKPANILLGRHGETQVIDWGLATPRPEARDRWADLPAFEEHGVVGTPGYMSPEQARGEPPQPADDVWSLGATLRVVLEGLGPQPELAAIAARATAPPGARYADAGALADDLLRWFEGHRVEAHEYTAAQLLGRFVRAWRVPLAVGLVGVLGVWIAGAMGVWRTVQERDRAMAAEEAAAAHLARARVEQATAATERGERSRAEALAVAALAVREDPVARGVLASFGRAARARLLDRHPAPACRWMEVLPGGDLLCGAGEATSLWPAGADAAAWSAPVAATSVLSTSPLLLADGDGAPWLLDRRDGRALAAPAGPMGAWSALRPPRQLLREGAWWTPHPQAPLPCPGAVGLLVPAGADRAVALCRDGTLGEGPLDGPQWRWVPTAVAGDHEAASLARLPDGRVLVGTLRGGMRLIDPATGAVVRSSESERGSLDRLRVSADGRLAAVGGPHGGVGIWSVERGDWVAELPASPPRSFDFDAGHDLVVAAGGELRRWALPTQTPPTVVELGAGIADVELAPGADLVGVATGDGRVLVIDPATGERPAQAQLEVGVVKAAAFVDGALLAAPFVGHPLVRLPLDGGQPQALPEARRVRRLVALPGGRLVGTALEDGLHCWSAEGALEPRPDGRLYLDLERRPDGAGAVGLTTSAEAVLIGPDCAAEARVPVPAEARSVDAAAGILAVALRDEVVVFDLDGAQRARLPAPGASLLDLSLSAGGDVLAAGAIDGRTRVWSLPDGALLAVLAGHRDRVSAVELAPDGSWLVTGSWDHAVRFWDLRDLRTPAATLAARAQALPLDDGP